MHIVCLASPTPPTYGGAIDMYYRIKRLHESGVRLILHVFLYRDATPSAELEAMAEKVFYYHRDTTFARQLSALPYIVESRRNASLLDNLCIDDEPILFEGLHTCYYLSSPRLAGRVKMVRMHNIEYRYYYMLAKNAVFAPNALYYLLEGAKLYFYERVVRNASRVLAITEADVDELKSRYPGVDVRLLRCFFDNSSQHEYCPTKPYIIYHANLSVSENVKAAKFIIKHANELIPEGWRLKIAGFSPDKSLYRLSVGLKSVDIIANPSAEEMSRLIAEAHINLLITFQQTGIKLKLLNTLQQASGHCVVNTPMLYGTGLRHLCHVADSVEELKQIIAHLATTPRSKEDYSNRIRSLADMGFNDISNLL